jgi:hypothetical protein
LIVCVAKRTKPIAKRSNKFVNRLLFLSKVFFLLEEFGYFGWLIELLVDILRIYIISTWINIKSIISS